jgi:hypothetical protein
MAMLRELRRSEPLGADQRSDEIDQQAERDGGAEREIEAHSIRSQAWV